MTAIFTDRTSCGYSFEAGRSYLVYAAPDGPRFHVAACSRTSKIESNRAIEDLRGLRAWKSGGHLAPRVLGTVAASGTTIRLIGEGGERTLRPAPDGAFSFDGLDPARYRLRVEDSRGAAERELDLTRLICIEAFARYDNGWSITTSPFLLVHKKLEIPVLTDPPPPQIPAQKRELP